MSEPHTFERHSYGIILKRRDGSIGLAVNAMGGPYLFSKWKDAADFRRELRGHKLRTGKIVLVTCGFEAPR